MVEVVDKGLEVENLRKSPLPMVLTELLLVSVLLWLVLLAVWIETVVGGELPPNMLVLRPRSVDCVGGETIWLSWLNELENRL